MLLRGAGLDEGGAALVAYGALPMGDRFRAGDVQQCGLVAAAQSFGHLKSAYGSARDPLNPELPPITRYIPIESCSAVSANPNFSYR